jgi:hypothetical protein
MEAYSLHLHAEPAEDGGVFAADDAGPVDGDGLWRVIQGQDGVAVVHAAVGEIHVVRPIGA